jgi:hypothetical protein
MTVILIQHLEALLIQPAKRNAMQTETLLMGQIPRIATAVMAPVFRFVKMKTVPLRKSEWLIVQQIMQHLASVQGGVVLVSTAGRMMEAFLMRRTKLA